MTTITRISSNYESRLHVEEDTDAKPVDCFLVTLCPYLPEPGLLVYRNGADMNELWKDALAAVVHLRAQPWKEIYPPNIFQPWATISARNSEDVRREMMLGELCLPAELERMANIDPKVAQTFHERGVHHLCRALDLIDGAPLTVAVPWPNVRTLN